MRLPTAEPGAGAKTRLTKNGKAGGWGQAVNQGSEPPSPFFTCQAGSKMLPLR